MCSSDLACGACVQAISDAVRGLDSTAQIDADTTTKLVKIETDRDRGELEKAIAAAGYTIA